MLGGKPTNEGLNVTALNTQLHFQLSAQNYGKVDISASK
jgi:hypothetical protein